MISNSAKIGRVTIRLERIKETSIVANEVSTLRLMYLICHRCIPCRMVIGSP